MEIKLNLKQAGVLAIAAVAALSVQARGGKRLSEYVNPFIGATTNTQMAKAEHGLGKTFPGVATPLPEATTVRGTVMNIRPSRALP